jgi:hypothetical protein
VFRVGGGFVVAVILSAAKDLVFRDRKFRMVAVGMMPPRRANEA